MSSLSSSKAGCPRCLLSEMLGQEDVLAMLDEWILSIPPKDRAKEETVVARIAHCRSCEELADGTCRLCGCYVDYRAAHRLRRCPALPPKWQAEQP